MNMRKIIAVLAAVLMLCAIVPMSALSVSADGSFDFEGGTVSGWQSGCTIEVVEDNGSQVLKWDASGADWANIYYYGSSMVSANTDYTVSFRAKADRSTNINFKVNNNWAGDTAKETVNVTTEWQEYSFVLNSGACTSGALLLFSSNTTAANGATYYLDDISFVEYTEPVEPGTVANPDFETGDLSGWTSHQSTTISTDAHGGSYAANLKGSGGWGGMLNQDVPVEAGKSYEVSLWMKANANGVNFQIKDGGTSGANLASKWFSTTAWTQLTFTVIPTTDIICFNFCGAGNGTAEDVLVDDIVVTELKDPAYDGYIYNGDFETGKVSPWTVYSGTAVSADAAYTGDYGLYCTNPTGGWGGTAYQNFTTEVGKTYVVWMYAKAVAQGQNIQIKDNGTTKASKWFTATEWTKLAFEYTAESTNGTINICGGGTSASEGVYFDDIVIFEKQETSNDGYIINGTFDDGALSPWNNLWGSCPTAEVVFGGKDSTFALNVVSGQWKHVRQTAIAVEPNTDYKITLWAKNVKNMNLLVKDNGDSTNISNKSISGGEDWTENVFEFNTGDYSSILVSFMGGAEEAYGTFDSVVMEKKHVCEFVGTVTKEATCGEDGVMTYACTCGEGTYTEVIPATGEHSYDHEFDTVCNVCDAVRDVVAPIIDVKLSISEDVNGLAFRFEANVAGFAIKAGTFVQADYTNATYNGYKLIETGAIATNGVSSIEIKGERMCDLDENGKAMFAYRIINIPADHLADEITMTPYYVVEIDGEQVTIYGEAQVGAYAEVAIG